MLPKRLIYFITVICLLFNLYGCIAIVAGAAGGAGAIFWLEGKIKQELNTPFLKTVEAAKSGMNSLNLNITKITVKDDVAQIMGEYTDARTIWIDIHKISETSSLLEIRVGAKGDKEASREILERIKRYL